MIWMKQRHWLQRQQFDRLLSMLFPTGLLCYDAASSFGANAPKMEDYI
jgi:hypothetical protein